MVYKDGIVLGADTRSTDDTTVADKNCEKIHYIAPNIYCGGAGTAADTGMIKQLNHHKYICEKGVGVASFVVEMFHLSAWHRPLFR